MKKILALVLAIAMLIIPMTALADTFIEPVYYADYTEDVEYVQPDDGTVAYVVTCRALNVRPTASTAEEPVEIIHRGDVVKVIEFVGNWAKVVTVDGSDAYVYGSYIEKC